VARLYAARARAEALELNRAGNYKQARAVLEKTARRIDAYAGGDAELKAIAEGLRGDGAAYEHSMNAKDQKVRYFESYSISMNRMPDGKARR
jgi:hypothetical protein